MLTLTVFILGVILGYFLGKSLVHYDKAKLEKSVTNLREWVCAYQQVATIEQQQRAAKIAFNKTHQL